MFFLINKIASQSTLQSLLRSSEEEEDRITRGVKVDSTVRLRVPERAVPLRFRVDVIERLRIHFCNFVEALRRVVLVLVLGRRPSI